MLTSPSSVVSANSRTGMLIEKPTCECNPRTEVQCRCCGQEGVVRRWCGDKRIVDGAQLEVDRGELNLGTQLNSPTVPSVADQQMERALTLALRAPR